MYSGGLDLKFKTLLMIVCSLVLVSATVTAGYTQDGLSSQSKLNQLNQQINKIKSKLTENKKKEKSISNQIENINNKIELTKSEMAEISLRIVGTEEKILQIQQELQETENKIAMKNDVLGARLRVMYKNGNVSYLQVLLDSTNFTDMLTRLDMIKLIVDHDRELLEFMKEKREGIVDSKKQLENQQNTLIEMVNAMEREQSELELNQGELAKIKKDILTDNKKLEQQEDELNRYAKEIASEIRKLQSNDIYKGGKFAWPAPGYSRITSPFGYRIHPILKTKKLHTGMDVAVPTGGKIVAAEAGKVIFSGWKGGYGKTVMVDHGSGIVTLYPHNSELVVKTGDKVKREQLVAKAGSTGLSTGPHLHFEVRKNGEFVDPSPWLK